MKDREKIEFKGTIKRCVYDSLEFKVYAVDVDKQKYPFIKLNQYKNATITGELSDLLIDCEYEFVAIETETKYGTSYKCFNVKRDLPTTLEETKTFLSEILTPTQAETLTTFYPDIIQRVKNNECDDIDFKLLKGIKEKTFEKIKVKIIKNYCLFELVTEFGNILSINMLSKIYERYPSVDKLKKKLLSEPYTTLTRVSGIGFKRADQIVLELQEQHIINWEYDVRVSTDRCLAAVLYLLEENENNGNTKHNLVELRKEIIKLVPECAEHYPIAIQDEAIYYNKDKLEIALRRTYECEKKIAETILANIHKGKTVWNYINVEKYRVVDGFTLSDDQIKILDLVCKNNICILNGFGGAGKTTSMKGLINLLDDNSKSYKLFAPTGRASKVLAENTHRATYTIHRGLGYKPPKDWAYNKECKLCTDIVIVDETSMVDIFLFEKLIDAINFETTKLLLIGDNAQLPSVSAGNLLNDFMMADVIPTVSLSKIFRYAEGGLLKVATDTRNCKPYLTKDMKNKATTFGANKDYMYIDLPADLIPQNAVNLYKKLLDNGHNVQDIQVLTAKNVGKCGTIVLNEMLQKVANKNYGSENNIKVGDFTYYIGDLVLQKQNFYEAEIYDDPDSTALVANGEIGFVVAIGKDYVVIDFDGIKVKYSKADMSMVGLGYCINLYKAQGGGFKIVILCTSQSDTYVLNSNLLYTGLTRMKEKLYHLGSIQTINIAVKKKANLERMTFMQDLLKN